MRLGVRFLSICVLAGSTALPAALAASATHSVTQTTLGGAKLGLTSAGYERIFRQPPFTTRLAGGTSRVIFSRAQVAVYLDGHGRGTMITTSAAEYRTSADAAPCGPLRNAFRGHPRSATPYWLAATGSAAIYRVGHLWFSTVNEHTIGSLTLAVKPPAASLLTGLGQCGTGGEAG